MNMSLSALCVATCTLRVVELEFYGVVCRRFSGQPSNEYPGALFVCSAVDGRRQRTRQRSTAGWEPTDCPTRCKRGHMMIKVDALLARNSVWRSESLSLFQLPPLSYRNSCSFRMYETILSAQVSFARNPACSQAARATHHSTSSYHWRRPASWTDARWIL